MKLLMKAQSECGKKTQRFCRAKDHEEGTECERSENAMQFLHHHHQLAMSLLPRSQSLGWCIAGQ